MDTCRPFLAEYLVDDLYFLGERCLIEPASRRLDGEIYCALHRIRDFNPLDTDELVRARAEGKLLVRDHYGARFGWIVAPPFTTDIRCAHALRRGLPRSIATL